MAPVDIAHALRDRVVIDSLCDIVSVDRMTELTFVLHVDAKPIAQPGLFFVDAMESLDFDATNGYAQSIEGRPHAPTANVNRKGHRKR